MNDSFCKVTIDTLPITDLIQLIEEGKITLEEVQGKKMFIDTAYFEKDNHMVYMIKIV